MIDQLSYITKEYIAQFLPENPIIIEAGAHKGRDSIELAQFWPRAQIFAFEPVPELFESLKKNIAEFSNIVISPFALSDKTTIQTFYLSDQKKNAVSSLLEPGQQKDDLPGVQFSPINVQTITLDDWAKDYGLEKFDLLWLDVQGAELLVFKGAKKLLATAKAIHCEVSLTERYKNQPLYAEIKQYLSRYGFNLKAEALYRQTWGNALFSK